jgi:hypothetical protein
MAGSDVSASRGGRRAARGAERFRAVLVWGDGTSQEIAISGGQAPIDIQIGQQLIRGLVWPATARRVNCDTMRW